MIELASLLLGLLIGVHPVELSVVGEVTAVEVRLDGAVVRRLEKPPWRFDCDFGDELRPHELVAVAFDAAGREVGRARRWINLSQTESSQAALSFTNGDDGWPVAVGVSWEAIGQRRAPEVVISFDGRPLAVADPARIALPAYDPADLHVISAEVRFARETSHLDAVFGGEAGRDVATDLTAVAVVLEKGRRLRAEDLQGWFLVDGRALTVHLPGGSAGAVLRLVAGPAVGSAGMAPCRSAAGRQGPRQARRRRSPGAAREPAGAAHRLARGASSAAVDHPLAGGEGHLPGGHPGLRMTAGTGPVSC